MLILLHVMYHFGILFILAFRLHLNWLQLLDKAECFELVLPQMLRLLNVGLADRLKFSNRSASAQ